MSLLPYPRVTPWVVRLAVLNGVVLLLLETLFTSPALHAALSFSPAAAFTHPWAFVTYMFVHGGLGHLAMNLLGLFIFGSAVESRMGSRQFILFYLYCGVFAAGISLLLSRMIDVGPFVGASGAILGLMVAFAMFWPDAEMMVFPIPIPIRARTLVAIVIGIDLVLAIRSQSDGIAHPAHLGGALAGWLFLRVQHLSRRDPAEPARSVERVVMVQSGAGEEPEPRRTPTPVRRRPRVEPDLMAAELDRVLDKISAQGLSSLTVAERRFLDEASRRKQRGVH
ncbi:MAG: rhomboid family intramembrane serine protease [Gemmatimonadales bacterium]|nr:rhomboid family intramembrane serine protease [Gemmatimonadales bacterium]